MPILIIAVFIGLLWAFVLAPVMMIRNKSVIKTMRGIADQYDQVLKNNPGTIDVESTYRDTLKRLTELKSKIFNGDKKSVEDARDIITLFTGRN